MRATRPVRRSQDGAQRNPGLLRGAHRPAFRFASCGLRNLHRAGRMTSSAQIIPLPARAKAPRREEREFLPAALEIIETPASPASRAIAATLIAFFLIALAWACLGHIDIIATAQG